MRATYKDIGIDCDQHWKYVTGHHNHIGIRQVGKYKCGPGGIDCPCCTKGFHPTTLKRLTNRYNRRKDKINLKKQMED